ncbi:MAG: hypothetical protein Ta2D_04870 [Rickettsiales bacterium]|nr:MAG: hypothetical protein Ta2D_04870 [Rickettsiales bacterium]
MLKKGNALFIHYDEKTNTMASHSFILRENFYDALDCLDHNFEKIKKTSLFDDKDFFPKYKEDRGKLEKLKTKLQDNRKLDNPEDIKLLVKFMNSIDKVYYFNESKCLCGDEYSNIEIIKMNKEVGDNQTNHFWNRDFNRINGKIDNIPFFSRNADGITGFNLLIGHTNVEKVEREECAITSPNFVLPYLKNGDNIIMAGDISRRGEGMIQCHQFDKKGILGGLDAEVNSNQQIVKKISPVRLSETTTSQSPQTSEQPKITSPQAPLKIISSEPQPAPLPQTSEPPKIQSEATPQTTTSPQTSPNPFLSGNPQTNSQSNPQTNPQFNPQFNPTNPQSVAFNPPPNPTESYPFIENFNNPRPANEKYPANFSVEKDKNLFNDGYSVQNAINSSWNLSGSGLNGALSKVVKSNGKNLKSSLPKSVVEDALQQYGSSLVRMSPDGNGGYKIVEGDTQPNITDRFMLCQFGPNAIEYNTAGAFLGNLLKSNDSAIECLKKSKTEYGELFKNHKSIPIIYSGVSNGIFSGGFANSYRPSPIEYFNAFYFATMSKEEKDNLKPFQLQLANSIQTAYSQLNNKDLKVQKEALKKLIQGTKYIKQLPDKHGNVDIEVRADLGCPELLEIIEKRINNCSPQLQDAFRQVINEQPEIARLLGVEEKMATLFGIQPKIQPAPLKTSPEVKTLSTKLPQATTPPLEVKTSSTKELPQATTPKTTDATRKQPQATTTPQPQTPPQTSENPLGRSQIKITLPQITEKLPDLENNPIDMFNHAVILDNRGLKKEAMNWYEKAANAGNADAMNNYGWALQNGYSGEANLPEAMVWYKKSAESGNVPAMFNYAYGLEEGLGGYISKRDAMEWYKKAAELGHPDAMLGYAYCLEVLCPNDYEKAMFWYKRAAGLKNIVGLGKSSMDPDAMYNYGWGLEKGYLGTKDLSAAMYYYKQAAEKGHPYAMYSYATCSENINDLSTAKYYYERAANAGNADAMYKYGFALEKGYRVTVDKKEAMKWYEKAAEKGHAGAMFNYGVGFEKGYNDTVDGKNAMLWYKKAADLEHTDAMNNYGWGLENGYSGKPNKQEAMNWYKLAAEKGNAAAMINYGVGLEEGYLDGESNKKDAMVWYKKAADAGFSNATAYIENNLQTSSQTDLNTTNSQPNPQTNSSLSSSQSNFNPTNSKTPQPQTETSVDPTVSSNPQPNPITKPNPAPFNPQPKPNPAQPTKPLPFITEYKDGNDPNNKGKFTLKQEFDPFKNGLLVQNAINNDWKMGDGGISGTLNQYFIKDSVSKSGANKDEKQQNLKKRKDLRFSLRESVIAEKDFGSALVRIRPNGNDSYEIVSQQLGEQPQRNERDGYMLCQFGPNGNVGDNIYPNIFLKNLLESNKSAIQCLKKSKTEYGELFPNDKLMPIIYNGVSNGGFAGKFANGQNPNPVDYFNAFCFATMSAKEKEGLEPFQLQLANGIQKAYHELLDEKNIDGQKQALRNLIHGSQHKRKDKKSVDDLGCKELFDIMKERIANCPELEKTLGAAFAQVSNEPEIKALLNTESKKTNTQEKTSQSQTQTPPQKTTSQPKTQSEGRETTNATRGGAKPQPEVVKPEAKEPSKKPQTSITAGQSKTLSETPDQTSPDQTSPEKINPQSKEQSQSQTRTNTGAGKTGSKSQSQLKAEKSSQTNQKTQSQLKINQPPLPEISEEEPDVPIDTASSVIETTEYFVMKEEDQKKLRVTDAELLNASKIVEKFNKIREYIGKNNSKIDEKWLESQSKEKLIMSDASFFASIIEDIAISIRDADTKSKMITNCLKAYIELNKEGIELQKDGYENGEQVKKGIKVISFEKTYLLESLFAKSLKVLNIIDKKKKDGFCKEVFADYNAGNKTKTSTIAQMERQCQLVCNDNTNSLSK